MSQQEKKSIEFGDTLKESIRRLAFHRRRTTKIIDEDLAKPLGYSGKTVEGWKAGRLPEPQVVEELARTFVKYGEKERDLLHKLLWRGGYGTSVEVNRFLDEILEINAGPLLSDVEQLIADKTARFVGRDYVFEAIHTFITKHKNGYFIIEGDPGMGKTTLLAEYVKRTHCVAYFNDRNKKDNFLKDVREQLNQRFGPTNAQDTLERMLFELAHRLDSQKLVIAVDALDEVDPNLRPIGANILNLPKELPENVYVILTRRRMHKQSYTLYTPHVVQAVLDLLDYEAESRADVSAYIQQALDDRDDLGPKLHRWINQHVKPPTGQGGTAYFVEQLARKSENNFMYLYWVLPDLAEGKFRNLFKIEAFEDLPRGLEQYYDLHWVMMRDKSPNWITVKLPVIATLVAERKPVSVNLLVDHSGVTNKFEILDLLQEWTQFIPETTQVFRGKPQKRYRVYHYSFNDFVASQPLVEAMITEQRQRIVNLGMRFF